jgi:dienelactone hydrolase
MVVTGAESAGVAILDMARQGRFDEIHDLFPPKLRSMASAASVRAAWTAEIDRHGPVIAVGTPLSEPAGPGAVAVKIPVTCERGALTVIVAVHDTGALVGLQFAPAEAAQPIQPWQPPQYADPGAFDEQEVMVGSGPLAVPGTLSLPHAAGPRPGIVLLAGSGPLDRDETMGRNKPFKDLAWGLAGRGIAVLRFDKVTAAHPREVVAAADFTPSDEYVPHAVAAVRMLAQHPAIDTAGVFVLGHSLGGTIAPRVAAAEPLVAGLVIMAGGAQPLHWAAVRQIRHLASHDAAQAAAARPVIDAMSEQARLVDSPDLSPSTPAGDLPFGQPAPYWLDLRGYDPAAVASAAGRPILILQGGRDYQATVTDDLALWKAGLAHHPDTTIRVYDDDNHLFFSGTGPSTPADYEAAQHMNPAVIDDIAHWLTARP